MNATRSVIVKSPKKKETPVHASWCFFMKGSYALQTKEALLLSWLP